MSKAATPRAARKVAALSTGALSVGAALAGVNPAEAATFTVTNLNDSGAGSLRQAIADANGAAGADVVDFQAGLTGTITLTTGQIVVSDSVDIQGPGAATLSVSGNNASRVFYMYSNSSLIDVTVSGLTITGGNDVEGGGIHDKDENLILDGVTIAGNHSSNDGGGLWGDGFNMNLTIRNSTISGNAADDDGGGIYIEDTGVTLLIDNTVISGNQAADSGGGIYFYDPDDDVTIRNSTLTGNTAGGIAGGAYLYSPDAGNWLIENTTVSANTATAGGGFFFYSPDHPMVIRNSTISNNQATSGDGGGVYFYNYGMSLEHTTVAGNTASGTGGGVFAYNGLATLDQDIVGDNTAGTDNDLGNGTEGSFDARFSLIEDAGGASLTDSGGNVFSQDAQLGPLQNNGGPTLTHLPAFTSPALNAGDPAFTPPPATDQRGNARVVGGRIDMGAVEVNPGTVQLLSATGSVNENAGTITVTASRTGGSDGAISATFSTSDGSAAQPGDYATAAGSLLWATGDSANKSFNITIVDDTTDEPDETLNATLTGVAGGATLGSPTTEVVTIVDDDVAAVPIVTVPTLGEYGEILLGGLVAAAGFYALRRKRAGTAAAVLVLSLALAEPSSAGERRPKDMKLGTLTQTRVDAASGVTLRLSDGSSIVAPANAIEIKDRRNRGRNTARLRAGDLRAGEIAILKIHYAADGSIRRVRVVLFDTLAQAQAQLAEKHH